MQAPPAEIEVVEAPPLGAKNAGGYGSAILARPGTSQVVFSRQMGSARPRWLTFDLGTGRFEEGKGFPGDLRDGVFDEDGAWLLGTYGLARVTFDPPVVRGLLTEGLGSFQHRLFRVTPTLLGITTWEGKSVALFDTDRGKLAKRLRIPSPDLVLAGDRPILCAFHAGLARELDLARLRLAEPIALPKATSPLPRGDAIVALSGPLAPYGRVVSASSEEPAGYTIRPEAFVVVACDGLRTLRTGGEAEGLEQLLGVDDDGRLVATAEWGFALIDKEALEISRRVPVPHPPATACWVGEARKAVLLLHYLVDPQPGGFDPVPEKLVVVGW